MAVLVKNLIAGTVYSATFSPEVAVGPVTAGPETGEAAVATVTGANVVRAIISNSDAKSRTR